MLHSISSQISILVAGLQRLEGQQRHPQPPLPPAAPGGQPPLPPPSTPAPASPEASSVRPPHPTVPVTLVATSTNRIEPADLIEPVSDSDGPDTVTCIDVGLEAVVIADDHLAVYSCFGPSHCRAEATPCSQGGKRFSAYGFAPVHASMSCLCRFAALLACVVVKLQEATLVNVQRLWWTGYHRQDLLLPMPHAMIVRRGTLRLLRLIRIRTVQSVHIPVLHRSVHRRRWSTDLVKFCRNSLLPSAMNISNQSRHGHRVSWMRWSDAKRTRIPGPPTRLSPAHRGSQAGMEGLPA